MDNRDHAEPLNAGCLCHHGRFTACQHYYFLHSVHVLSHPPVHHYSSAESTSTSTPRTSGTRSPCNGRMARAAVRSICSQPDSRSSCGTPARSPRQPPSAEVRLGVARSLRNSFFPPCPTQKHHCVLRNHIVAARCHSGGGNGCGSGPGAGIISADGPVKPPTTRSNSANVCLKEASRRRYITS